MPAIIVLKRLRQRDQEAWWQHVTHDVATELEAAFSHFGCGYKQGRVSAGNYFLLFILALLDTFSRFLLDTFLIG